MIGVHSIEKHRAGTETHELLLLVHILRENGTFFEFSLCLSRACLGKIMHFIYKWRKKCRFLTLPTQLPARPQPPSDSCSSCGSGRDGSNGTTPVAPPVPPTQSDSASVAARANETEDPYTILVLALHTRVLDAVHVEDSCDCVRPVVGRHEHRIVPVVPASSLTFLI
jgi:hypothetical protein